MASQRTMVDSTEAPVTGHWTATPPGSTTPFGNSHGTSTSIPVETGLHFREGSGHVRKAKAAAIRADISDDSAERLLGSHSYPPPDPRDHAPISAPTVFSRHAAPLYLPQLDKYISSLPLPAFSSHSRTKAYTKREKFVPLDRLASTGRNIESLETNFKGEPGWRNRNLILGGLVSTVLGITVGASHSASFSLLDAP